MKPNSTPSATLTFLYTDIEGSTRQWERRPEAMRRALERHDDMLRAAISVQGGQVFRTAGDAFCAVFTSAPAALRAAVAAQRDLYAGPWELEEPLQVRMAIHTGEAEFQNGDYVGASLNRIGRLLAAGHGGQTLLTLAAEELVRDDLPEGVRLFDLGPIRFRDLAYPEQVFQVVIAGLPERFPPLRSVEATPHNLPAQLTSFVGRERELAEVADGLSTSRLLTITGVGGTGKTRLALEAATRLLAGGGQPRAAALSEVRFPDGAWLVELATLANPELASNAVAVALGVRELSSRPPRDALVDYLRNRKLLLLLDNCEHLLDACASLTDTLLQRCPALHILATSREPLGLAGERVLRVASLSLPESGVALPAAAAQSEAVQLFAERAAAVKTGFTLTAANTPAVIQICRRLDGIPLAIELAAARARLLSPEALAARLDDRFRLLTGGSRTALPRQQTLEALIDWSYDLLSEPEQALFRRLAVFSGGFSLEAAEGVCGEDVLDLLDGLANKSLVLVDEEGGRFRLLETIRQYAQEKLFAAGEAADTRSRHLDFYADFARQAHGHLWDQDQPDWLARVQREYDNLRAALEWALDHDLQTALELAGSLAQFWNRSYYASQTRRALQEALDRAQVTPEPEGEAGRGWRVSRALALFGMGILSIGLGDNARARAALMKSTALYRDLGDPTGLAQALAMGVLAAGFSGDIESVRQEVAECLALAEQTGDTFSRAMALGVMGNMVLYIDRDLVRWREIMQESRALLQLPRYEWYLGTNYIAMGGGTFLAGEYAESREWFEKAMAVFRRQEDERFYNAGRSGLADIARAQGDDEEAVRLYQEVLVKWQQIDNRGAVARCLECLAFIVIQAAQANPDQRSQQVRHAATLLGAAEGIRQVNQAPMTPVERPEYESQVDTLRALALPGALEQAWAAGRAMDLDSAVAYAMEEISG